jgi:hypothetical protein
VIIINKKKSGMVEFSSLKYKDCFEDYNGEICIKDSLSGYINLTQPCHGGMSGNNMVKIVDLEINVLYRD